MIDHCFSTNEQIISWKNCLPPFDNDYSEFFSEQTLLEEKQNYFIHRETKNFVDEKFNRDLALVDWRTAYQQRKFFLTTLEKRTNREEISFQYKKYNFR